MIYSNNMCGRFAFFQPPSAVAQSLQNWDMPVDESPDDEDVRQTYNFAPGYYGLIYRADTPDYGAGPSLSQEDENNVTEAQEPNVEPVDDNKVTHYKLQSMKWGLVPFWTKRNPDYGTLMRTINCRDDSLADGSRSMWTSMKKRKRCIVICNGFYEWLKKNNGKERIPHYIKRKDDKLMCFAGLWDMVQYEDSEEKNYTFTIITTDANKEIKWLHDRMPVILNPGSEAIRTWLDPKRFEWSNELQSLLKPWDGELEIYPVSKDVGKVGNDSSSFIIPINSTENKKNIVNFFNKQAELSKSPKKVKAESADIKSSNQEKKDLSDSAAEAFGKTIETNPDEPPPSTAESKTGVKRELDDLSDIDEPTSAKKSFKKSHDIFSPSKNTRKMHSSTSNNTVSKGKSSPKKVEKSKKITTFFTKSSS